MFCVKYEKVAVANARHIQAFEMNAIRQFYKYRGL